MIDFHSDALEQEPQRQHLIPCSAEAVVVELLGDGASLLDPQVVRQATAAVLHYFKVEQGKSHVTVGEFTEALVRVLQGFGIAIHDAEAEAEPAPVPPPVSETDLDRLLTETGPGGELFFFRGLRDALNGHLARAPAVVRFHGLRACVRRLTGARRWSRRCGQVQEQIVDYLRRCLLREPRARDCLLLVR